MDRSKLDEIIAFVSKALHPAGYECIEAEWESSTKILRLFIDNPNGITLDHCVAASHILTSLKELDDLIPGTYVLEVSSPGLERPLRSRSHFERHIGELIQVRLASKISDRRKGIGKLVSVSSSEEVVVETAQGAWSFPLDQVHRASLVYNWGTQKN